MKKLMFIALFAIALSSATLDAQENHIQCPVSHVTVFRHGAQLTGDAVFTIQPGTFDYIAGGLSPYIDPNSIQVRGEGDFMITGVTHRNNYLENPAESAEVKGLREKIDALQLRIEDEQVAMEVMLEKERFLKANYDVVTEKSTITPEQLRALIDLYGSNMESVKGSIHKKLRIIKEYTQEKEKLEQQLAGTIDRSKMPTGEIVVSITGSKPATGKLNISYVVMNAGWQPAYDIRVDDISDPAVIIYKANVWQNSGIEWKDVKISLSNAAPMTAGSLPLLYPWFIDFYQPVMMRGLQGKAAGVNVSSKRESEAMALEEVVMVADASAPMPVSVSESNISFSFDVNIPKTIATGGKPETVELQRLTVPAAYSYATTPKITPAAYLVGYITEWDQYNLLPGESNIYFSNTFTGKGYINTAELTDTLTVSLGADNSITVKRDRRKDFTSQKLIGSNRVETLSFLISVRNNKSREVNMKLRDQLPLPQNSDITVEAVELSGGNRNIATGEVTWDLTIAPRETREIIFTYSVRYPKNRKIILE